MREPFRRLALLFRRPAVVVRSGTSRPCRFCGECDRRCGRSFPPPLRLSREPSSPTTFKSGTKAPASSQSNLTLDLAGQPGNYDGLTNYTPLGTTLHGRNRLRFGHDSARSHVALSERRR